MTYTRGLKCCIHISKFYICINFERITLNLTHHWPSPYKFQPFLESILLITLISFISTRGMSPTHWPPLNLDLFLSRLFTSVHVCLVFQWSWCPLAPSCLVLSEHPVSNDIVTHRILDVVVHSSSRPSSVLSRFTMYLGREAFLEPRVQFSCYQPAL